MTVSWGFVHRNRKIGPLFGRSFGKCFAVISGLYRTPGRARTGPGWTWMDPGKSKNRLKIDFEPLFPISGKWQENRHLGDFLGFGPIWADSGTSRAGPGRTLVQGPARTSPSWSGSSPRSVRELAQVDPELRSEQDLVQIGPDLSRIWLRSEQDLLRSVAYVGHMLTCLDTCHVVICMHMCAIRLSVRFPNNFWNNISARDAFPLVCLVVLVTESMCLTFRK